MKDEEEEEAGAVEMRREKEGGLLWGFGQVMCHARDLVYFVFFFVSFFWLQKKWADKFEQI